MLMTALLMAGFAAGYPLGQRRGFSTGSEWALVQANILARDAGLFMPVKIEAGNFRVMMKQPKHLYRTAWMLADRYEDELSYISKGNGVFSEGIDPKRNAYLLD